MRRGDASALLTSHGRLKSIHTRSPTWVLPSQKKEMEREIDPWLGIFSLIPSYNIVLINMPRFAPVLRGSLGSTPGPAGPSAGYALSCRKLVLEYSEKWLSSKGATSFVGQYVPALAARYPSVEVVCMEKPNQHPLVRAFYNTDREKVVSLRNMEPMEVAEKLSLLLDSSGKKLTNLKRKTVVAGSPESARGMWSQLHGARN